MPLLFAFALLALAPLSHAHRRRAPLPRDVLAPAAHPRSAAIARTIRAWRDIEPVGAADPVVRPIDFGADPTGRTDSTAAFAAAVAACLERGTSGHGLSFNVTDLGGVVLDLGGGDYEISAPIVFPAGYGNYRIIDGSLRASPSFDPTRHMVEFGTGECHNSQGSCAQDTGIEGVLLDGGHVAAGGILETAVMGCNVGPQVYVINFTTSGIQASGGHELMVHETWIGELLYSAPNYDSSNATGIVLNSNDHYINDVIVYSGGIGLLNRGAANFIAGLHTWNKNFPLGVGIVDTGNQNRYDGCYLDGNDMVLAQTNVQTVINGFFLGEATLRLAPTAAGEVARELYIAGNEFWGGSGPTIAVNASSGSYASVEGVTVVGNVASSGRTFVGVEATLSAAFNSSAPPCNDACTAVNVTLDFSSRLLFPGVPLSSVLCTAAFSAAPATSSMVPVLAGDQQLSVSVAQRIYGFPAAGILSCTVSQAPTAATPTHMIK